MLSTLKSTNKILGVILLTLIFVSCTDDNTVQTPIEIPEGTHFNIVFTQGVNWQQGLPIFEQNLREHIDYQTNLSIEGTLAMAAFLLEEDRAFYVQKVNSEPEIDAIIANDPAVKDEILKVEEKRLWSLSLEQVLSETEINNRTFYLVEYEPGSSWISGKPLWEQDLATHITYVTKLFDKKELTRGGPLLNQDKGMYIVLADDLNEVQDFITNDPGVVSGILKLDLIRQLTVNVDQL